VARHGVVPWVMTSLACRCSLRSDLILRSRWCARAVAVDRRAVGARMIEAVLRRVRCMRVIRRATTQAATWRTMPIRLDSNSK
jgi:hypothetical protein